MKIYNITDEYGYDDYSFLDHMLDVAIKKLNINGIFSITFIDDEKMREMNYQYRNIDNTTDVLSFALNDSEDNFDEQINVLGDIFISIPRMKKQAEEYGHSEKRELSFLTIHGLLHLLGYDHMNKDDEEVMFSLQEEVLNESDITK